MIRPDVLAVDEIPFGNVGQYGAAGTILGILLWVGWQWIKRERDRADKNEAEIARLNASIIDKHAVALDGSLKVANEVRDLLLLFRDATPRRRP